MDAYSPRPYVEEKGSRLTAGRDHDDDDADLRLSMPYTPNIRCYDPRVHSIRIMNSSEIHVASNLALRATVNTKVHLTTSR